MIYDPSKEQSSQPLPAAYVRNTPVLQNLIGALRYGDPIVQLVGAPGIGKTALLRSLVSDRPKRFDGAIEYFGGSPSFLLVGAVDVIAKTFRRSRAEASPSSMRASR